jgi:uncharacterized membrane protein YcaP (DUF421 family)
MWELSIPWQELVARSVLVYSMFLFVLRISGKRELGQFTIFDLALVLLAANAMQPAITGPDASIPGALVIIATLFTLNTIVAFARQRSALARRLLEPSATVIARDGAWIPEAIVREGLDDEDVMAALREHGLDSISDVRQAVLERDGSISVVPREGGPVLIRRHRRYRKGGRQGS